MFPYSTLRQPMNYADRVRDSHNMSAVTMSSHFTVVVDDLVPHNASGNNPLWCGWGPAPNSAWLIDQHSKVALAQTWFKKAPMDEAITALLGKNQTTWPRPLLM